MGLPGKKLEWLGLLKQRTPECITRLAKAPIDSKPRAYKAGIFILPIQI
jgi:hypothetical protein